MKLILMEFVSLDGVSEGPGSPEENTDTFHSGGWLVPHMDASFIAAVTRWVENADAFLFGRRTYESFARDWPAVDDPDDPFAPILNGKPKSSPRTRRSTPAGSRPRCSQATSRPKSRG